LTSDPQQFQLTLLQTPTKSDVFSFHCSLPLG